MHKCNFCQYVSKKRYNVERHMRLMHKTGGDVEIRKHPENVNFSVSNPITSFSGNNDGVFDIRLKENFKMFVSGPSRCGKTVFVSKLLENIHAFAKQPPFLIIYVYKVWQPKYDEMQALGVNFKHYHDNIVDDITSNVSGEPILVIFDDLIGSSSLKDIDHLFTIDRRHMNMSLVFS